MERRDCRTEDVTLFDLILEHAKVQHRYYRLVKEKDSASVASGSTRPAKAHSAKTPKQRQSPPERQFPPERDTKHAPPRPATKTSKPPIEGCLVCRGAHWFKEFPVATEEQRQEALQKFRAAKEQRVRSKAARRTSTLNNIPSGVVETLRRVQPDVRVQQLGVPVQVTLANGRVKACVEEVVVDLALTTTAGLVNVRDVSCLVLHSDVDEFLLGKDTLHSLGIDVDAMLGQLSGDGPLGHEEDELPGEEVFPTAIDVDVELTSVDDLINKALRNGMDMQYPKVMREVASQYDVWADKVGFGPPVAVESLRVTLQDGAVQFRCKQRKYPPLHSQFLRNTVQLLLDRGLIRRNNGSRWASAAVPVRKSGTVDKFRLTVEYRPVNARTVPITGTMPNVMEMLDDFAAKKKLVSFDMKDGF
ncbi:hypothetical protein JG687_00004496 [Phytophthora cactorum]|uniref:Reverse transcriptase domain-containing protein n=1 Tax=Phytophthora cactorum TaxID=29920 RepID=A0A329RAG1_9STRA|nr:hypothetical protein PC112_g10328 [Phytophthora cactorum]KAG2825963.1 hypothetical protein PC111_g9158 [Phytophthora cactorum]KAG2857232.1 hypothetical protein PC113_g10856 [Phytophthora cactorum]KAG2905663.1 hypothetical protein PC114_g11442 [Phytophthora cactorum]KAG2921398.1 hypothetical protein PC115_g9526 [Phytophthora cactorum]